MAIGTDAPGLTMTFEEFLEWADEDTRAEWVDGRVEFLSPVDVRHDSLFRWLLTLLNEFNEEQRLGQVLAAPFLVRMENRPSGREPDIMFVLAEHLDRLKGTYLQGPPDLVVEIISPESVGRDRGDKFIEYEKEGVQEYWLIDPIRKQAEFYRLAENGIYRLDPLDGGVFHSGVLTGLWIAMDWLWQEPRPRLRTVFQAWGIPMGGG